MKKILIKINNDNDYIKEAFGYIIGVKDFSILFGKVYDLNSIIKLREKYSDKKIFVSLNKPIFNNEIDDYKWIIEKLDNIGLDGIIVSDQAALTYNLKTNIILDFLHLNNSYLSINHYYKNGAYGVFLTNDITKDEINAINENTNAFLFKQVFGYSHLSTSRRMLISNYLEITNKKNRKSRFYEISENDGKRYKIYEDKSFTHILSDKVLNLLKYMNDINCNYYVIDSFMIDKDLTIVYDAFLNNKVGLNDEINSMYNASCGFINEKTIYKVIKNDK